MNPLDLSPAEFQDFLTEERQYRSPEQIDDLIRRYNAANSLSGRLAGLLEPQEGRRRTSILPASVPEGMSLMEALQSGEAEFAIPQGVVDMVTGTVRGVENPALAAQGRIPASDMNAAGFETAASAMGLGGLLATKPAGSLGMSVLRDAPDEGFDGYLSRVNPSGTRIAAEDRPNLMMGDMYGMLPRGSDIIGEKGDVTFHRSPDGDYYATAYNPDVGEQDVIGYIMGRGDSTELQVVSEMQGQGIGGELQYLFRSENPDAPTGGLTEAGERALERTYDRLFDEGLVSANASKTSGFMGQLLNADDIPAKTESQKVAKRILQLRSKGRANEVTEEMMEDADPLTMAAYTPLDMSTKARMERAGLLGFNPEEVSIHGAMDNPERFTFDSDITPVYTSDNPAIANTYTAGEDSAMFDLLVKQGPSNDISDQINNLRQKALDVDVQGASYAAISPDFKDKASGNTLQDFFDVYLYPENRGESVQHLVDGETVVGPVTSTDQIAYAMRDEGVPHARIENVLDRGPYSPRAHPIGGFGRSRSFEEYKETDAANRAWERTMQDASRKPSTDQITFDEGGRLRSRFARFDPEFSHLKNLTAANASPLVGLLTQGLSEKQANKIEDYLYRTGLLQ
jgi:hypothetical protein